MKISHLPFSKQTIDTQTGYFLKTFFVIVITKKPHGICGIRQLFRNEIDH